MKNKKLIITLIAGTLTLTQAGYAGQETVQPEVHAAGHNITHEETADQSNEQEKIYNDLDTLIASCENDVTGMYKELAEIVSAISQNKPSDEEKEKLLTRLELLAGKTDDLFMKLPSQYDLKKQQDPRSKMLADRIEICHTKAVNLERDLFRSAIQLEPTETPNPNGASLERRFAGKIIPKPVMLTPEQMLIVNNINSAVALVKEKVQKLNLFVETAQANAKELNDEEQNNIESQISMSAQNIGHDMFSIYNVIQQLRSEVKQQYGASTAKVIFGRFQGFLEAEFLDNENVRQLVSSIKDFTSSRLGLWWSLRNTMVLLENIKVDKNLIFDEVALYPVRTEPIQVPLGKTFSLRLRDAGCCGGRLLDTPRFSFDTLKLTRDTQHASSGFCLLIPEQTENSEESTYDTFLKKHIKERGLPSGCPLHIFNFKAIKKGLAYVFIPSYSNFDEKEAAAETKDPEPVLGNFVQFIIE